MNLKSKLKMIVMLSFMFIFLGTVKSFATSISVSPSKGTVSPGEKFSVTISGSDATGRVNISASNGTVSQSSAWIENNSVTVSVTAGSSGTVNISVSGELSSNSGVDTNVSKSASVTIQAPQPSTNPGGNTGNNNQGGNTGNNNQGGNSGGNTATKDTNANLKRFGFNPSEYDTFKFNANTLEYRVNVPNELSSIIVYAEASYGKSKVSGAGTRSLKEGNNRIDVTVTAEAGNKKTYTLWVNRAIREEGEVPPNVIDEPEEQQPEAPKGLASFEITGYELDKEFKTDAYEYVAKTEEKITKEWLEEVKKKIVYTATDEGLTVEATTDVLKDEKGTITIVVKEGENEVAKYVITFEREKKEEEPVAALINSSNSGNGMDRFDLTYERRVYIILGILGITLATAVFFAVDSYLKTNRLEEYEEDQEYEENSDFERMNEFYMGVNGEPVQVATTYNTNDNVDRISEELSKEEVAEDTVSEVTSSLKKLGGYRNMRGSGKTSGRHF